MAETLHIFGRGGKLGRDLGTIAIQSGIEITDKVCDAEYIAICTPSHVAQDILDEGKYIDKTVIDLSGAAKRSGRGQYGLMRTATEPWHKDFNVADNLYGNPGCIASAVILGLAKTGLTDILQPPNISVVSVGGQTHAPTIGKNDIRLARRLYDHPHVGEIERAFDQKLDVAHFTPVMADVPAGLLVNISGTTTMGTELDYGVTELTVQDVVGTASLKHRLSCNPLRHNQTGQSTFSLGVVLDNLRFVTNNAVELIHYLASQR